MLTFVLLLAAFVLLALAAFGTGHPRVNFGRCRPCLLGADPARQGLARLKEQPWTVMFK